MIKSICVDTLTAIQEKEYMKEEGSTSRDKWRDYGKGVYSFMLALQELGFTTALILGNPGTGEKCRYF